VLVHFENIYVTFMLNGHGVRVTVMKGTLDTVLLCDWLWYGMCRKSFHSVTCSPMQLSTNSMNHAFASPAEAGFYFTEPGGMEG